MELVGVRVELPQNTPIVLLREAEGRHRVVPIYIGGVEATAIAYALEKVETPRPMTHDLLKNTLDALGVTVATVVISDLQDHTFFAELELSGPSGTQRVSARPSDAIALAVRTGTPIFAEEAVIEEAGLEADESADVDPEELVSEFRQFIEDVDPEDFAS